jgi:ATP-dependent Clp protease protease subunit
LKHFWNFARDGDAPEAPRTLYLLGEICPGGTWYEDAVTPDLFHAELSGGTGPVTVYIDSIGGDVFAAAQIYNALKSYPGEVTVHIGSLAASAASVVAMAGDSVLISPVGLLLIHNPATVAMGDSDEMRRAAAMLDAVKESIINAYQVRTGLSRKRLGEMMNRDVPFDAREAIAFGFADGLLFESTAPAEGVAAVFNRLPDIAVITQALSPGSVPADDLTQRLSKISH